MKIQINCMQCFQEQGFPSSEFQHVEIQDNGIYSSTCNKGHSTLTVLQEQKFEVLFDFGGMALLDGYPREAITSFAASLERFYEFYITVITLKNGVTKELFSKTWGLIAAQSERQFGAFIFCYLLDHRNSEAPLIDNDRPQLVGIAKNKTKEWKEFRNAIIHKGYIPSTAEALAYGNLIYQHINGLIRDLKTNSEKFINQATSEHIAKAYSMANGETVSTMSSPTMLSLTRADRPYKSLEDALEELKNYRHLVGFN